MSEKDTALERLVLDRLRGLHRHLQIVHAGVVVAAGALRHQNAERDEEIARVLEYCVGDRLAEQIERTAEFIASLQPVPTDPADVDSWNPRRESSGRVSEAVRSQQLIYTAAAISVNAGRRKRHPSFLRTQQQSHVVGIRNLSAHATYSGECARRSNHAPFTRDSTPYKIYPEIVTTCSCRYAQG